MTAIPAAPKVLSANARRLWREVLDENEMTPAELEVWRQGLMALDRADQAAEAIAKEGVTVLDRYGSPKTHPAFDIEARSRAAFAAAVKQLGINVLEVPSRRRAKPGPRPKNAAGRPG